MYGVHLVVRLHLFLFSNRHKFTVKTLWPPQTAAVATYEIYHKVKFPQVLKICSYCFVRCEPRTGGRPPDSTMFGAELGKPAVGRSRRRRRWWKSRRYPVAVPRSAIMY